MNLEGALKLHSTTAPKPSSEDSGAMACLWLDDAVPGLRDTYRRLALVSHPRHLEHLERSDTSTLVVSCNWLLWQQAVAGGWHCVHYQSTWPETDFTDLESDLYLRANDWIYAGGEDLTLFRGVSLGRKFVRDTAHILTELERLRQSLEILIARYRPAEVAFFDFQNERTVLGTAERLEAVSRVVRDKGVRFIDRAAPPDIHAPHLAEETLYGPGSETGTTWKQLWADFLQVVFEGITGIASRLSRSLSRRRPSVLMLVSQLNGLPLIDGFSRHDIFPLYLAKWYPRKKNLLLLIGDLTKGMLIVGAPRPRLGADDLRAIDDIQRRLETAWQTPGQGWESIIRTYVGTHILASGGFHRMAEQVIWAERLLDRYRPDIMFTDGLQNKVSATFLELARKRGIRTSATWHSLFIDDMKMEVFGSDPRFPSLVDHCLTWGHRNERWLDATGARCTRERTGAPIAGHSSTLPTPPAKRGNVLFLQCITPHYDTRWPHADQYAWFVDTVRMLRESGYENIRVKLHPGPAKVAHHRLIAETFDLDCEIVKDGRFMDHVAWADIVIGPVYTGATLEVLAAGKPYFAILPTPSVMKPEYLEGCRLFSDLDSLRRALEAGEVPDSRKFLNGYTSIDDFPDPVTRVWETLHQLATR